MSTPAFPGGTSVSRLTVYTGACADGLEGGTPHLHTASTEAYVVTGGRGVLQTLSREGFAQTPLAAGTTVWFTPGTVHRAVNHGGLEVVVLMSNAGLPEAGDAVMTFPPEVVEDPAAYRAAATLPAEGVEAAVAARRDLAVEGFLRIAAALRAGDTGPLERLYAGAAALVRPSVAGWRRTWERTVAADARRTERMLDALARGDGAHLGEARLLRAANGARWGMCGHLVTHQAVDVTHDAGEATHDAVDITHEAGDVTRGAGDAGHEVGKVEIRRVGYLDPDARLLVGAALDDLRARYETEDGDATPVDPADFDPPHGAFFVAYLDGEPAACGAWRAHGPDAEIKRMYTAPSARGRGLARAVLSEVERSAREHGRRRTILETGGRQPEAIRLYETSGYRRIPDFGFYKDAPDVRSFAKEL